MKICPVCNKSFTPNSNRQVYCSKDCKQIHLKEYNKQYNKDRTEWLREHHICIVCGKEEPIGKKVVCENCLEKQSNYQAIKRKDSEYRNKMNKKRIELKRHHRKNGLCVICGKPIYKSYSTCYEHYIHNRLKSKAKTEQKNSIRIQKEINSDVTLCYRCDKPALQGKKLCAYHYKIFFDSCISKGIEANKEILRNAKEQNKVVPQNAFKNLIYR